MELRGEKSILVQKYSLLIIIFSKKKNLIKTLWKFNLVVVSSDTEDKTKTHKLHKHLMDLD